MAGKSAACGKLTDLQQFWQHYEDALLLELILAHRKNQPRWQRKSAYCSSARQTHSDARGIIAGRGWLNVGITQFAAAAINFGDLGGQQGGFGTQGNNTYNNAQMGAQASWGWIFLALIALNLMLQSSRNMQPARVA